jgi:hypothetical protein
LRSEPLGSQVVAGEHGGSKLVRQLIQRYRHTGYYLW